MWAGDLKSHLTMVETEVTKGPNSMSFLDSVRTCIKKWNTFSGRAKRAEYWWFFLFSSVVYTFLMLVLGIFYASTIEAILIGESNSLLSSLSSEIPTTTIVVLLIWSLIIVFFTVAQLAAGSRRLHDIDKSGWWQLLYLLSFIPLIGLLACIYLIYLYVQKSHSRKNRFG